MDDQPEPTTTCKPSPCVKGCLDKIMGEDVKDVIVTSDPAMAFPYAFTQVNTIVTRDSCSGFFGKPEIVIEEYFHVVRQWNTGRLSSFGYLRDNWTDGGYAKNRWEKEAKNFAAEKLKEFQKCIECCK